VRAERIERLAREFAEHAPAIAIIGGAPLAHTNGMFNALAVNALNALAGSVSFMPQPKHSIPSSASFTKFIDAQLAGPETPTKVLLLHEANPVYGSPAAWRVRDALTKIPFIASFGRFHRRDQHSCRPDSSGSFLPGILGRRHSGIRR
jgi:hypothetical protein